MDGQTITGNNNEGDNITKTKIVNHGWGGRPNKTPFIMITWGKTYLQNHISTIEECMTQGRSCNETQSEKDSNQMSENINKYGKLELLTSSHHIGHFFLN